MSIEINARTGNSQMVPAHRFNNWKEAEQFLRAREAVDESIEDTRVTLARNRVAVMAVL